MNRYSALKSLGEKKACFNEYVEQRKRDEVAEKRAALRKARDEFTTLLEESAEVKAATRFSKAAGLFGEDPRWKARSHAALPVLQPASPHTYPVPTYSLPGNDAGLAVGRHAQLVFTCGNHSSQCIGMPSIAFRRNTTMALPHGKHATVV